MENSYQWSSKGNLSLKKLSARVKIIKPINGESIDDSNNMKRCIIKDSVYRDLVLLLYKNDHINLVQGIRFKREEHQLSKAQIKYSSFQGWLFRST